MGRFLHHRMGLPAFIGELLGLAEPVLKLQATSDAANEVGPSETVRTV